MATVFQIVVEAIRMDIATGLLLQLNATVAEAGKEAIVESGSSAGSIRPKSTPEGMMTAYVSLVVMALIPIVIGAHKSVDQHRHQKEKSRV